MTKYGLRLAISPLQGAEVEFDGLCVPAGELNVMSSIHMNHSLGSSGEIFAFGSRYICLCWLNCVF